ncbi:MAG: outer membrane lipoprotein carrier protein LolA [Lentimicrobiaceae bacterium]|nr:outer membrane lipoprotein carrier protein LolA [Lentimicrobiaceae bacterium]
MIKKKKIFIVLLFISGVLCAQNVPPTAAPILEKTAQKYNALSSFSLDFMVNIEETGKKVENFKGVLLVKKDKYFLTFDDQIIANDGKTMWVYQESANEVALFEAEDDDFSMFHPTKMLNNWEKEYTAKFIREEELQKKQVFVIDLTPKKKMPFYKIRLFIDKTTSHIQQIMMYEPEGATVTYTITKFTPNVAVSEGKFSFNKEDFPGVEVVDMR